MQCQIKSQIVKTLYFYGDKSTMEGSKGRTWRWPAPCVHIIIKGAMEPHTHTCTPATPESNGHVLLSVVCVWEHRSKMYIRILRFPKYVGHMYIVFCTYVYCTWCVLNKCVHVCVCVLCTAQVYIVCCSRDIGTVCADVQYSGVYCAQTVSTIAYRICKRNTFVHPCQQHLPIMQHQISKSWPSRSQDKWNDLSAGPRASNYTISLYVCNKHMHRI